MNLEIDTREFEERIREVMREFPEAGKQCMQKACLEVEGQAKRNAPVDTGTLRSSLTHSVFNVGNEIEGIVYTHEEYAPFVELGTGIFHSETGGRNTPWRYKGTDGNWYTTSGQKPKKFLSNALTQSQNKIKEEFARILEYVD